MYPEIAEARYVNGYTIWVRFSDGAEGLIDLGDQLYGEVFEPLKDLEVFMRFKIHPDFRTLCWDNGADFAPEFLRAAIKKAA